MDKYKAAHQKHKNALELLNKKHNNDNQDHEDISNVAHNLALDCFCLGYFDEAEKYFTEELRVKRKFYGGDEHKEIAGIHNNLGNKKREKIGFKRQFKYILLRSSYNPMVNVPLYCIILNQ
jgi:hypothetical protein